MYEQESLALARVTTKDLSVGLAEPVDLVRPHTIVAVLAKAVILARVQEPESELDIGAVLVVDWEHIVESMGKVASVG